MGGIPAGEIMSDELFTLVFAFVAGIAAALTFVAFIEKAEEMEDE